MENWEELRGVCVCVLGEIKGHLGKVTCVGETSRALIEPGGKKTWKENDVYC